MKRKAENNAYSSPSKIQKPTYIARCGTEVTYLISKSEKNSGREYLSCSCQTDPDLKNVFVMWRDDWEKQNCPVIRCRNASSDRGPPRVSIFSNHPKLDDSSTRLVITDPELLPAMGRNLEKLLVDQLAIREMLIELAERVGVKT